MMIPLLLSLFLLLAPKPPNPVTIDVYTPVIMVHNQVRVRMTVLPDEVNRELILEWFQYPGFENKKFFQLDGAASPRVTQLYIKLDEPGDWTFQAVLMRNDGSSKLDSMHVRVIGTE